MAEVGLPLLPLLFGNSARTYQSMPAEALNSAYTVYSQVTAR